MVSLSVLHLAEPMSLELLEKVVNEVSDKDLSWWPFLWLRPEKDADFSLKRLVSFALLYGLPSGALFSLVIAFGHPEARSAAPMLVGAFPLLLLFFGSVVVGPMWNRRAERLRAGSGQNR